MTGYVPTGATITERVLLLALVEFAPNIEPSTTALALMVGTDERSVRRLLRSCEAKGLLEVEHRMGQRSRYTLKCDPGLKVPPDAQSPLTQGPPTPDSQSSPPRTQGPPKQTSKADKKADKGDRARGTTTSKRSKTKAPEIALPIDWQPTAAHRAYATKHGLDLEIQADAMRGWAKEKARTTVDWDGRFSTWLAKAAGWKRESGNSARKAGPTIQRGAAVGVNMQGENSHLFDDAPQPKQLTLGGAE